MRTRVFRRLLRCLRMRRYYKMLQNVVVTLQTDGHVKKAIPNIKDDE